jgi:uncharacterized YccA/Bax inhibitor family protein
MRTGNPALTDSVFTSEGTNSDSMTLMGTALKTSFLLSILLFAFGYTWDMSTKGFAESFQQAAANPQYDDDGKQLPTRISIPAAVVPYVLFGGIGGFLTAMVIIFNPKSAPFLSPLYAGLEGLVLGGISAGFEARYPGIALQAGGATFGTLTGLLLVYSTGLIKPSENFKMGILAAMFGICGVYFLDIGLSLFGVGYVGFVHQGTPLGIAFSVFVVAIAAFNLVLDFDFIEDGVENKAPKYMEWYGAFGLMVSLIWLYMEILRLIAKARSND